jgi:hypothetical protein
MARDLAGNELKVGDHICVSQVIRNLGTEIVGKIVKVSDGGLAPPSNFGLPKGTVMGGSIQVVIETNLSFDPRNPVNVLKIVTPTGQAENPHPASPTKTDA